MTLKVEDISHPVMDQMGYVYEREAIHREIDRQQRRELQCPAAGLDRFPIVS